MNTNILIIRNSCPKPRLDKRQRSSGSVSVLAHEVRDPLGNINVACDMLQLTNLDPEQRQLLDFIVRSSGRIDEMINALLRSYGIREGKYEHYPLQQLVEEALMIVNKRIMFKRIEVSKEFAPDAGQILLDVDKMKTALTNILIHAIEALPPEKGKLRIVTRSAGETSRIEIHDNGRGISKTDMERINDPYFIHEPGLTGLGLSATLDLLLENHVCADIRSSEKEGTTYILSFEKSASILSSAGFSVPGDAVG